MKILFTDFWESRWDLYKNPFTYALDKFGVSYTIDSNNPDIIIHSLFGEENKKYHCKKIFFTGEPAISKLNGDKFITTIKTNYIDKLIESDAVIGFERLVNSSYLRFPLYALDDINYKLYNIQCTTNTNKTKFCYAPIYNPMKDRFEFIEKLSKYSEIHVPTHDTIKCILNDTIKSLEIPPTNCRTIDKINMIKDYKFCIAFENTSFDGYITEKMLDSFYGKCIPIYKGHESVTMDFDDSYFINYHRYNDYDKMIEAIIELDLDDDRRNQMVNDSYKARLIPNEVFEENFVKFIKQWS